MIFGAIHSSENWLNVRFVLRSHTFVDISRESSMINEYHNGIFGARSSSGAHV